MRAAAWREVDDFKLQSDDTMRRLRSIAQTPGELQWRLELLDTLNRMRVSQEIANRAIASSLVRVRREISHLTPSKIEAQIDRRIESKRDTRQASNWRAGVGYVIHALQAIAIAYLLWKLKK